jgi:hypothetical protein
VVFFAAFGEAIGDGAHVWLLFDETLALLVAHVNRHLIVGG